MRLVDDVFNGAHSTRSNVILGCISIPHAHGDTVRHA